METNAVQDPLASPRELIVMMRPESQLRASAGRFESLAQVDVSGIQDVLNRFGASMQPLFGSTEESVVAESLGATQRSTVPLRDLSVFYGVQVEDDAMDELADALSNEPTIETAYVKPGAEPAVLMDEVLPQNQEAPPMTPEFSARQGYLAAAPEGVDAHWAWLQPGGDGQGVRIIDIEGAWRFTHEDLTQEQGGVIGGTQSSSLVWRNHGTAVLGEYGGDLNGVGVRGISPGALASAVSVFGLGSSAAIRLATSRLRAGDVILIELHRPGPRHNFQSRPDQQGYVAIEWWEDDFAAIQNATRQGIIVIEAAGNGAQDLDDSLYEDRPNNFPGTWTNPFRRRNRDSGAIVVGAGAPPPGTHGRTHGPDRSRLNFSNYGALIDAQGWGREVTTCGYGDLQGGSNEDLWYTDRFSGTSSASPIVVGVAASLQGMTKAQALPVMTPSRLRQYLRATGSTQQGAPGRPASQNIGTRPNLRALHELAFGEPEPALSTEYLSVLLLQ